MASSKVLQEIQVTKKDYEGTITSGPREEWETKWLKPLMAYCQNTGTLLKYFDIKKIQKAFLRGYLGTFATEIKGKVTDEREEQLREINPDALYQYRLNELVKKYPAPAYYRLVENLKARIKKLENNSQALYTQKFGNIFEMNWDSNPRAEIYVWYIAVQGSFKPPEKRILSTFGGDDSVTYVCKPFADILINNLGAMKEKKVMIREFSNGKAMLLSKKKEWFGSRKVLSILSEEVANQQKNSCLSFIDINNGMALWIKATSKTTKTLFYIPELEKGCNPYPFKQPSNRQSLEPTQI
jgi:hypothetical protein